MKILLLPNNIASMTAITVDALNEAGHEAKGLILQGDIKQSHRNLKVFNYDKKNPFKVFTFLKWYFYFLKYVLWADVIHWNGSFSIPLLKITLPVIKFLKKPALVEFVGSDIRNPEIEFLDNPYYKSVFNDGYEYNYESAITSIQNQKAFSDAGFQPLAMPGMEQYIDKTIFKRTFKVYHRIRTKDFMSNPPEIEKSIPVIVHSPSAPVGKGTKYVLSAIEKLKANYNFKFILIKDMPHKKAIELMSKCDIYIDQLISGNYGMAAMEAMSFGKPVVTFLKESVLIYDLPIETPLLNANPHTILEVLETLLKDGNLRHLKGREGRVYVEKYHDVSNVIPNLVDVYKQVINLKRKSKIND